MLAQLRQLDDADWDRPTDCTDWTVHDIADRSTWSGTRIIEDLARLAPKGVHRRRKTPALLRSRTVPGDDLPAGSTFGYLFDVIYARDLWMHRIDIARATGCPLMPTESDTLVVTQVVRDLARYWDGPPLVLQLTGEAGGSWLLGTGSPVATVRADAVEYCRLLSGRTADPEFAIDGDEAVRDALAAARVTF